MNKIARTHGVGPIRELIESMVMTGTKHSLSLKPSTANSLEMDRAASSQCNYSLERSDSYLNSSLDSYPYYDREMDRNSMVKLPPLKTISSLSTNPELNDPRDFYQCLSPELDNDGFNQANHSMVIHQIQNCSLQTSCLVGTAFQNSYARIRRFLLYWREQKRLSALEADLANFLSSEIVP